MTKTGWWASFKLVSDLIAWLAYEKGRTEGKPKVDDTADATLSETSTPPKKPEELLKCMKSSGCHRTPKDDPSFWTCYTKEEWEQKWATGMPRSLQKPAWVVQYAKDNNCQEKMYKGRQCTYHRDMHLNKDRRMKAKKKELVQSSNIAGKPMCKNCLKTDLEWATAEQRGRRKIALDDNLCVDCNASGAASSKDSRDNSKLLVVSQLKDGEKYCSGCMSAKPDHKFDFWIANNRSMTIVAKTRRTCQDCHLNNLADDDKKQKKLEIYFEKKLDQVEAKIGKWKSKRRTRSDPWNHTSAVATTTVSLALNHMQNMWRDGIKGQVQKGMLQPPALST